MSDTNKDFSDFGNKALILAVLYLILFILGILVMLMEGLSYVIWVIFVVIIVFLILAASSIGKAGDKLNNEDLRSFSTRIKISVILISLGIIMVTIGMAGILNIVFGNDTVYPQTLKGLQGLIIFGIIVLIGIAILIIGAIFELLAWTDMRGFLKNNMSMFPENIGKSAQTGSLLCMIGAILTLTFIGAFLGYLLRAIGYFMLAKLKDLE